MQDCRLARIFAVEIMNNVQWSEVHQRVSVCPVSRKQIKAVIPLNMVKRFQI